VTTPKHVIGRPVAGETQPQPASSPARPAHHRALTRRRLILGAAALTAAAVLPSPTVPGRIEPPPAAEAAVLPLYQRCRFGAYADNAPYPHVWPHYGLESIVGAHLGRMSWFQDMGVPWLDQQAAEAAHSNHDIMIAWQPSAAGRPIRFSDILAGHWDTYLTDFFQHAANYPGTVILRPFWEMNASAGAYSLNYTGPDRQVDSTTQFIATWQYLVKAQRAVGGTQIKWFFCANGTDTGPNRAEQYWPGTEFVDEIGFDTYNDDRGPWSSFEDRVTPMYGRLTQLAPHLPMTIGEIGCTETGAPVGESKSSWTEQMFLSELFPQIRHISFFNAHADGNPDWRLNSSTASLATHQRFLRRAPGATSGR